MIRTKGDGEREKEERESVCLAEVVHARSHAHVELRVRGDDRWRACLESF